MRKRKLSTRADLHDKPRPMASRPSSPSQPLITVCLLTQGPTVLRCSAVHVPNRTEPHVDKPLRRSFLSLPSLVCSSIVWLRRSRLLRTRLLVHPCSYPTVRNMDYIYAVLLIVNLATPLRLAETYLYLHPYKTLWDIRIASKWTQACLQERFEPKLYSRVSSLHLDEKDFVTESTDAVESRRRIQF